jgi:hypothetical protein
MGIRHVALLALAAFFATLPAHAQTRVANAQQLRAGLNLESYRVDDGRLAELKIAVLDNSFEGYLQDRRQLPPSTQFIEGPSRGASGISSGAGHGLLMAQAVWAMAKFQADGPKFYLIQANGITNLRAAIDKAIDLKVDVILYSVNWETGGNFDGNGFINAEVKRATEKKILWINAAGNYRGTVLNGQVDTDQATGDLRLPGPGNKVQFSNELDANNVTLTLSWNDYKDSEEHKTSKDLDLELQDVSGTVIPLKNFRQGARNTCDRRANANDENAEVRRASDHAREQVSVKLDRGSYTLRILDCSGNFTPASDDFRLNVMADKTGSVQLRQASRGGEIMIPADNPSVLTVGDRSPISALGPTTDGRAKPDLLMTDSSLNMTDGRQNIFGSSTAAALFAGVAIVLKSQNAEITKKEFDDYLKKLRREQRISERDPVRWRTPSPSELSSWTW